MGNSWNEVIVISPAGKAKENTPTDETLKREITLKKSKKTLIESTVGNVQK